MRLRPALAVMTIIVTAAVTAVATPAYAATARWGIEVVTACANGAGTDGDVGVIINGPNGTQTSFMNLDDPNRDDFESCSQDYFRRTSTALPYVQSIVLFFQPGGSWLPVGVWIDQFNSTGQIVRSTWHPTSGGWFTQPVGVVLVAGA